MAIYTPTEVLEARAYAANIVLASQQPDLPGVRRNDQPFEASLSRLFGMENGTGERMNFAERTATLNEINAYLPEIMQDETKGMRVLNGLGWVANDTGPPENGITKENVCELQRTFMGVIQPYFDTIISAGHYYGMSTDPKHVFMPIDGVMMSKEAVWSSFEFYAYADKTLSAKEVKAREVANDFLGAGVVFKKIDGENFFHTVELDDDAFRPIAEIEGILTKTTSKAVTKMAMDKVYALLDAFDKVREGVVPPAQVAAELEQKIGLPVLAFHA